MANKEYGSTLTFGYVLHLTNRFLLKFSITYSKNFIYNQYFGFQMGIDDKPYSNNHTRGVSLYGAIDILLYACEIYDFIKSPVDFGFSHTHNRTIHKYILPSCHFRMKACAHFKQGSNTTLHLDGANGGGCDTR